MTGIDIRCVCIIDMYIAPGFKSVGVVINDTTVAIEIRSVLFQSYITCQYLQLSGVIHFSEF